MFAFYGAKCRQGGTKEPYLAHDPREMPVQRHTELGQGKEDHTLEIVRKKSVQHGICTVRETAAFQRVSTEVIITPSHDISAANSTGAPSRASSGRPTPTQTGLSLM